MGAGGRGGGVVSELISMYELVLKMRMLCNSCGLRIEMISA